MKKFLMVMGIFVLCLAIFAGIMLYHIYMGSQIKQIAIVKRVDISSDNRNYIYTVQLCQSKTYAQLHEWSFAQRFHVGDTIELLGTQDSHGIYTRAQLISIGEQNHE